MADTDIKIKLTADPKPVRDAIKLIDRDLKELGGPILTDTDDLLPPEPPIPPPASDNSTEPGQKSSTSNSERVNQNQRDRTNRLILRELIALRRELQKTNQNRSSAPPPPTGTPPGPIPPPPGPTPPPPSPPGGGPSGGGSGSGDPLGGNNKIIEAIGKLSSLWSMIGVANSWGQKGYSREELAYKTYGSLLVYDEYNQAGRDAANAGIPYGYSYEETMQAQKANMRYAGFHNLQALGADTDAIFQTSAAYGLDNNQVATAAGRMTGFGIFKIGEQQKFANMLAQSIQEHGMQGREDQELQVLQSISENLASRNTTVTEDALHSGVNLYSALATINPNLRGERGGTLAEKMMGMTGQDIQPLDLLAGFGSEEYQGVEGRQRFRRWKEDHPQEYFQKAYDTLISGGSSEKEAKVLLGELIRSTGNFSQHEIDDMIKAIASGNTFNLSRDTSAGEQAREARLANWEADESLSEQSKYKQSKEAAQSEIGNIINNITAPFKGIFNDMSQGGQMATTAAMTAIPAIGGGLLMSKLGGLATSGLSGLLGGSGAGGAGNLSGLLGGAGTWITNNAGKLVTGAKIGGSVLTGGIAAYNTYGNLQQGDYHGASESAAGGVGAIYGGIKGAGIGAGIGTAIGGPIGTILGGLIGGGIGALAGNWLGEGVGGTAYDILGGSDKDNHLPEENSQGKPTTRDNPEFETSDTLKVQSGLKGQDKLKEFKETNSKEYYSQAQNKIQTEFSPNDTRGMAAEELQRNNQNPHDRFDTQGMRTFTPRDQAQIIIQQTEPTAVLGATQIRTPLANEPIVASSGIPSYAMYTATSNLPKPSGETLLAQNPALMDSRGGNLLAVEKDEEDDDTRGTLERQFRLMEQDTRSTVENTKALEDNTKALEKKNKNSIIDKILSSFKGSGGTSVSTTTPVVTPVSPIVSTSPSQTPTLGSKVNNPLTVPKPNGDYNGEGGGGEGTTWKRQGDWVSFEGAQDGMLDAIDILAKFFQEQTGHQLVVTAGTNGDHPSNGTAYGHDAGYKFDINDWGGGGEGSITTDDGSKGWFVDQMIAFGRSKGLGMNWEGDHLDVSLAGEQWDGNGENAGGFRRPTSHAHGKDYVPYDNYPALLHKGERVLTRLEANELRNLPGVHLPPELQIDEDNDSISDRKQKRAAQEQYQYDSSHTQTNLSVVPGLRQMATGGEPSEGQTLPKDPESSSIPDFHVNPGYETFSQGSENPPATNVQHWWDREDITFLGDDYRDTHNLPSFNVGDISLPEGEVYSGPVGSMLGGKKKPSPQEIEAYIENQFQTENNWEDLPDNLIDYELRRVQGQYNFQTIDDMKKALLDAERHERVLSYDPKYEKEQLKVQIDAINDLEDASPELKEQLIKRVREQYNLQKEKIHDLRKSGYGKTYVDNDNRTTKIQKLKTLRLNSLLAAYGYDPKELRMDDRTRHIYEAAKGFRDNPPTEVIYKEIDPNGHKESGLKPIQMAIGGSPSYDVPALLHKGEMVLSNVEDKMWQSPISTDIGTKTRDIQDFDNEENDFEVVRESYNPEDYLVDHGLISTLPDANIGGIDIKSKRPSLKTIIRMIETESDQFQDYQDITTEYIDEQLKQVHGNYNFQDEDSLTKSIEEAQKHQAVLKYTPEYIQHRIKVARMSQDTSAIHIWEDLNKRVEELRQQGYGEEYVDDSSDEVKRAKFKVFRLHQLARRWGYDPKELYMDPKIQKMYHLVKIAKEDSNFGLSAEQKEIDPKGTKLSGLKPKEMAVGGNVDGATAPTPTMLQPGDSGYEVQQEALRKRAQQVQQYAQYAKEHKTNTVPGLNPIVFDFQSPPKTPAAPNTSEWDKLSAISTLPQNNSPEQPFGDLSPTVPTGLELLLSLRSQTDELGNMLYGTDSGYNKITDNDTKDVARLKRLAQLRNTSTTDTLFRYYLTHPPLQRQTMSLPSPKPEFPTTITPETATETKPKQKFRPLRWLSKMWKSVVQDKQNQGIWSSLKSIIRGKGGPEHWLNLGTEILKATQRSKSTRHQSVSSDPLSTLQDDWFNADGTPNLDSGLWQSKGVPKAVQQASLEKLPKDTTPTDETLPKPDDNNTDESTTPLELPKEDSPDVPKDTEDTSSPAPKKKNPNILQWLQSKDTVKIITQMSKHLGGKHQKTLSKIGAFLGGLSSTSSGLLGLQDSMFKKDGTPNLDSGLWTSPGWPQPFKPNTDESTTPLELPKEDSPDVPKDTEDTSSPAPKKKNPNILQWLQSKDTVKIITQMSKHLGGKHQKTLSKIGAFLGGLSSTSSGLLGLQDSMFKKDGTPNLDSGLWTSPGWPQPFKPNTDESTTPLELPKDTGHPNNPLSIPLNKENFIPMLNQTPPIPTFQQTIDGSSSDMNANSISVELTVHVDGKIDGMNESNQGAIVTALVSRFKQPDWLSTVSNGYMRRANR